MSTRLRCGAVVLVLGLALTACGGNAGEEPSAARTASNGDVYTDADVDFATEMIQHHAEAVRMVVLAQDRPLDPEARAIANAIRDAQVGEVETMVDWLSAWGEEIPETSLDHSSAHDDAAGGEDLERLEHASDAEFQELWLELMIDHHQGAIVRARTEQQVGRFKPAVALARTIVQVQQSEIAAMQELAGLTPSESTE